MGRTVILYVDVKVEKERKVQTFPNYTNGMEKVRNIRIMARIDFRSLVFVLRTDIRKNVIAFRTIIDVTDKNRLIDSDGQIIH